MRQATDFEEPVRTGWISLLARISMGLLLTEIATGLVVTFGPFHAVMEWSVLVHTIVGAISLLPLGWYLAAHWMDYRRQAFSDVVLLGYVAALSILVCAASGVVVTWQGLLALKTSTVWRNVHLVSTFVVLACVLPHMVMSLLRRVRAGGAEPAAGFLGLISGATAAALCLAAVLAFAYSGTRYVNAFPKDYSYLFGKDRPFAPSLARTSTGGAFDPRSLSGSETCGTTGCHSQILEEWRSSAHRYSAMDSIFQGIQGVMAKQNGPESTRYCAGCHDPISLFSGSKNIYANRLTNAQGYQEGISCIACHSIQRTDLQGNANYTISQPHEYLWQWSERGLPRLARDFLIRTYPAQHNKLSKRMYKAPEYCAACHKQFIDQEVNRVGWVQLQNQYDNWAASHWNHKGDPRKTVECRECHMPLVESNDPASGDQADYNRSVSDRKHRSHRFLASNNLMPALLKLPGWENQVRQTEDWLKGHVAVPEIQDKWAQGPVVRIAIEGPDRTSPGQKIPLRVILTSNKVGHDYPTGPLDLIQSWVEVNVQDSEGNVLFASGRRNKDNFIEPGTFLFKAEPVDQYGNLIDRHNLWEMVGVRYRRSLFPGYSDTVEYVAACPSALPHKAGGDPGKNWAREKEYDFTAGQKPGPITVTASLMYRKVDQFLLNYVLGKESRVTAPAVRLSQATATIQIGDIVATKNLTAEARRPRR